MVHSRDDEEVGVSHEIKSPENQPQFSRRGFEPSSSLLFFVLSIFSKFFTIATKKKQKNMNLMRKATCFCLTSLQPERCLLAYHSTCNAFFRALPVSSFVFHSSLLTVKSVNLVAGCTWWLPLHNEKSSVFFIVVTFNAEVLFKHFLIRTAV